MSVPETFAICLSFSINFNKIMNIAIVGATGNVGRKILEVLEKKELSIDNLYLLASSRSAGSIINFNGKEYEVIDLETFDFSKVKITFFAAGGKISENFAEIAAKHSLVIDNSSFYRMDPDVPLIVPQVNSEHLNNIKKKLMGIKLDAKEVSLSGSLDLKDEEDNIIGELRSACYSPHFEKVIGIAMMKKPYWEVSQGVKAEINGNICTGIVCDLPFI